jgi:glucan phosphoethanolaminetransferase (alkaline phosphatase superfamily)
MNRKTQKQLVGLLFLLVIAWVLIRGLPYILSLTANLLSLLIILVIIGLLWRSDLVRKFLK